MRDGGNPHTFSRGPLFPAGFGGTSRRARARRHRFVSLSTPPPPPPPPRPQPPDQHFHSPPSARHTRFSKHSYCSDRVFRGRSHAHHKAAHLPTRTRANKRTRPPAPVREHDRPSRCRPEGPYRWSSSSSSSSSRSSSRGSS